MFYKFIDALRQYFAFLSWIIPDSIWRNKVVVFFVLLLGFLGVAFQVKVFALMIYYSRHFSSGEIIRVWNLSFDPRSSFHLLIGGSLAIFISLCCSSICINLSKKKMIFLGRHYEEFCSKRVFYCLQQKYCHENVDFSFFDDAYLYRLVRADCRIAGRVLRLLLSLIIPSISLFTAVIFLIYLEQRLTFMVLFLAMAFFYSQYIVSRLAAKKSMIFEKLASRYSGEIRKILYLCKEGSSFSGIDKVIKQVYGSGAVKQQLDAYEGRLCAVEDSRLISGFFMAFVFGLVIAVMGSSIIREGFGWDRLFAYLVALRFALVSLQTTFSMLTNINRFYPQVRRYHSFLCHNMDSDLTHPQDLADLYFRFNNYRVQSDETIKRTIKRGDRLSVVTSDSLNHYTISTFVKNLVPYDNFRCKDVLFSSKFVTTRHQCPDASLKEMLYLTDVSAWSDISLPQSVVDRLKRCLPSRLENRIKISVWDKIDSELRFAVHLYSAICSDCKVIFVEEEGFRSMGRELQTCFSDLLLDKILIIVFSRNINNVGVYGENGVAIIDNNQLVGVGSVDWFATKKNDIEILFSKSKSKKGVSCSVPEEDEIDDDY